METTRNLLNLSPDERRCLAYFDKATPSTLSQLADDDSDDVREGAARHLNTPPNKLLELVEDANSWVSVAAQDNPSTPVEVDIDIEDAELIELPKPNIMY